MAKPKGATLAALWEVSESERREFFERIQKRAVGEIPVNGIPETGTPSPGPPNTVVPNRSVPAPRRPVATETRSSSKGADGVLREGAPISGTPYTGIPNPGAPAARSLVATEAGEDLEAFGGSREHPCISGTPDSGSLYRGIPDNGIPNSGVPLSYPPSIQRRPLGKIRRATQVQDGHSLGEQLVLTTLWKDPSAAPAGPAVKRITIGYRTLSEKCRLTVNNCKANLRSLHQKLAIEPIAAPSNSQATTYLVYDFAEIMRRRESAGLTHVIRSKGSAFVNPETGEPLTGMPFSAIPRTPVAGAPVQQSGTPGTDITGVPDSGTPIRNKNLHKECQEKESSSSVAVISATVAQLGILLDDDAVSRLTQRCRDRDPAATHEEIAHFLEVKVHQLKRSRTIGNWVGLLIASVPEFFQPPATELARYRQGKATAALEVADREQYLAAEARKILDDPNASENEKAMAHGWLPETSGGEGKSS